MRKRSLILLLLPIVIILWTLGWAFLWTGTQQTSRRQKTTKQQEDNIRITVQLPEQKQEITE